MRHWASPPRGATRGATSLLISQRVIHPLPPFAGPRPGGGNVQDDHIEDGGLPRHLEGGAGIGACSKSGPLLRVLMMVTREEDLSYISLLLCSC